MTTRQTPDAVREAAEEIVALPHFLDIGYAQDIARRILAALDSRAGDAGEIDNGYSADDAGDFVFNRLAEKLGLAEWQVVEGSEEWEGDVSATLHRLLIDAGIIDDETGVVATLATPAPAVDAVPAGEVYTREQINSALRTARSNAMETFGIRWAHLEEISRIELTLSALSALSHGEGRK